MRSRPGCGPTPRSQQCIPHPPHFFNKPPKVSAHWLPSLLQCLLEQPVCCPGAVPGPDSDKDCSLPCVPRVTSPHDQVLLPAGLPPNALLLWAGSPQGLEDPVLLKRSVRHFIKRVLKIPNLSSTGRNKQTSLARTGNWERDRRGGGRGGGYEVLCCFISPPDLICPFTGATR